MLAITALPIPGARPALFTLVHILRPLDNNACVARLLADLGRRSPGPHGGSRSSAGPTTAAQPPLTAREQEILAYVAIGLQNKEIAQKLDISLATVRNHVHNILEKLDVHSKLELVSLAFRRGWVSGASPPRS